MRGAPLQRGLFNSLWRALFSSNSRFKIQPPSSPPLVLPPLFPLPPASQKSPIVVKTLTSAALFGLGDFMSQKLEGKELDTQRLLRLTAWGGMFAPLAHVWYGMLDKMVPGQGAAVLAKKVAADQVRGGLGRREEIVRARANGERERRPLGEEEGGRGPHTRPSFGTALSCGLRPRASPASICSRQAHDSRG